MRLLKVYTDGSVGKKTSTWGFLISGYNPRVFWGDSPKFINTSNLSEALALIKAVEFLLKSKIYKRFEGIVFNTDCMNLSKILNKKGRLKKSGFYSELYFQAYQLLQKLSLDVKIEIKHVKAHDFSLKKDCVFNRMVDYIVRREMKTSEKNLITPNWKKRLLDKIETYLLESTEKQFWASTSQWSRLKRHSLDLENSKILESKVKKDILNQYHQKKNVSKLEKAVFY